MTSETSVSIFTHATQMLAEANTIQKAKDLKDLALTAADWAKRKGMGEEAVQYARSWALEAERKMGEMLAETKRAKGGQPYQKSTSNEMLPVEPTLSELGISKRESSDAQVLASLSEESFESVKTGEKTLTQIKRESQRDKLSSKITELLTGKYRIFYADPPWSYNDKCDNGSIQSGGCEKHYPSMNISELCALPILELTDDNAVLFLWVTSPILQEAFPVIKAWGFTYKASFVWDKVKHNMGHYNSVRHEFLLICTRGSCLPDIPDLIDSVQSIERTGKHSQKPEEFRNIIDKLYPNGSRIELFARTKEKINNWSFWGNEI